MNDLPRHGFVNTTTVATHIGMAPSWVRAHADELGGHRFGTSIRFDVRSVRGWIDTRRIHAEQTVTRRRPGPKPGVGVIPANVKDW